MVQVGPRLDGDGLDVETLTRAEVETRLKLWDQVQELRKQPGMESLYLLQTATSIGVRETRRILGEYVLTEQDAIDGKRFPDVIAISSNPMPELPGQAVLLRARGLRHPLPLAGAEEDRRPGALRAAASRASRGRSNRRARWLRRWPSVTLPAARQRSRLRTGSHLVSWT